MRIGGRGAQGSLDALLERIAQALIGIEPQHPFGADILVRPVALRPEARPVGMHIKTGTVARGNLGGGIGAARIDNHDFGIQAGQALQAGF